MAGYRSAAAFTLNARRKAQPIAVEAGALPRSVRAAFRAMSTGRPGAAHLGLPLDVQRAEVDVDDVGAAAEADPEVGLVG